MSTEKSDQPDEMTPDEEHEFCTRAENQEPQGGPRRRTARLTTPIPVRFPPEVLEEIKRQAEADDRTISSWIRRAVEQKLHRSA
jgi:predicted HicB family RNase H-like nuclease